MMKWVHIMPEFKTATRSIFFTLLLLMVWANTLQAYYTTQGQNIIHRETGEVVQLRGIGLGGWLLPEGYMWGIRKLDRPRQFEAAIVDLIGEKNARKFWDTYYANFVTREEVEIMKSWGVNTLRVPLLASMIQPREGQPDQPPFIYDEHNFAFIDNFVEWCEEIGMGIIWDLHGAPGGQNAENISDSDGEARLWTEKAVYWPLTIDLWDTITRRYADNTCIVGYDLLNEPLLARYPGVDPGLLRELYVLITEKIRETDQAGIIFIEGDDWAQDFVPLEPMDWDPHLVLGFHSYPPTHTQSGLQRWDEFRTSYDMPLWHGETGEQNPPWELYKRSTRFLDESNVGWNWWTHKKFELSRQPWSIPRTEGFEKILAYWNGKGERPSKWQAKRWLLKQALMTNSVNCEFLPGMVESLYPLDPGEYVKTRGISAPEILSFPSDAIVKEGFSSVLRVKTRGYPIHYQWYRNGALIPGATSFELFLHNRPADKVTGEYHVVVSNEKGSLTSEVCTVENEVFNGPEIGMVQHWIPEIDAELDPEWESFKLFQFQHVITGSIENDGDLGGWFRLAWDLENLYVYVRVIDDIISSNSSVDHMRDGVEIYIDTDNSKSTYFGEDEFQLRVVLDDTLIYSDIGQKLPESPMSHQLTSEGYDIETSIPWEHLNGAATNGAFLGIDVHVNDNDSNTRSAKLSWYTSRDNAYQSPANFGTVRLIGD